MQWAKVNIDAARFHEMFIDGEYLQQENILKDSEASLCKTLNASHLEQVKAKCKTVANVEVHDPIVVGVDSLGIDIRATFGIVRVPFDMPVSSSDEVVQLFT